MINVGERVKKALIDKGWTQKKLCQELDLSENGFKNMLDKNTWKIETLQRIAEKLDLPVTYFLTEQELSVAEPKERADGYLMKYLTELEQRVQEQSMTIRALVQQLGKPEVVLAHAASCAFFFIPFGYNFGYNLLTGKVKWL